MLKAHLPLPLVWLLVTGCATSAPRVVRHGRRVPALADDCGAELKNLDPQRVYLDYEVLGIVTFRGVDDELTPDQRRSLTVAACRLGSRAVVPSTMANGVAMFVVVGAKRTRPLVPPMGGKGDDDDSSPVGAAPPEAIIAVFDVEDRSEILTAQTAEQLADYLATKLAETRRYRVVPRDSVRARLVQQRKASYRSCYDSRCQIEIGKALAAQASVSTKILKVGDRCAVTTNMFDLRSEATTAAASVHVPCTSAGLLGAVDQLVAGLQRSR